VHALENLLQRRLHGNSQLLKPELDTDVGLDRLVLKLDDLTIWCDDLFYGVDFLLAFPGVLNSDLINALVHFLDVLVDRRWVFPLSDNLKQVIVGQEVEPRELPTLSL